MDKGFAERILRLESLAEKHGDPESLAAIYFAMYKKKLISTTELEIMIASYLNREGHSKINNIQSRAATIALADAITDKIRKGESPNVASLNYLKWCYDQNHRNIGWTGKRPEVIHGLFKIMRTQIVAPQLSPDLSRNPDWEFLQKLLDHVDNIKPRSWYPAMRLGEKSPESVQIIQEGITSICHLCRQNDITIPESFKSFLNKNIKEHEPVKLMPALQDSELRALEEKLESEAGKDKQNAFRLISQAYIEKINRGDLSYHDWQEAVFQTEVAPHTAIYTKYNKKEGNKLKEWYMKTKPRIAAANAELVASFEASQQRMTSGFRNFVHSPLGLQSLLLSKEFHNHTINCQYDSTKSTLALSRELLALGGSSITVLDYTEAPEAANVAIAASKIPNVNGLILSKPLLYVDEANNTIKVSGGFIRKDDQNYHVFDPNGEIQIDYWHVSGSDKPWYPSLKNISVPRMAESDCIDIKGITSAILEQNGIKVPTSITFWREDDSLSPAARKVIEDSPNAYTVDKMSIEAITQLVHERFTTQEGASFPQELVIKPVDGERGQGVKILSEKVRGDFAKQVAEEILAFDKSGKGVVIQKRVKPPLLTDAEGRKKDCTIRVTICPNENGESVFGDSCARVGYVDEVISMEADSKEILVEDWIKELRQQHPDLKPEETDTLHDRIIELGKNTYQVMRQYVLENDPPKAGEDPLSIMGIDIMIDLNDGKLTPTVIETNGPRSATFFLIEILSGDNVDKSLVKKYEAGYRVDRLRAEELIRQARRYKQHRQHLASAASQTIVPTDSKSKRKKIREKAEAAMQAARKLRANVSKIIKGRR